MAIYVINASGDDYDEEHPDGYQSWIDYWNKKQGKRASICRCRGEKVKSDIVGGHVEQCFKGNDGNWYVNESKVIFIVPLCKKCNNPENSEPFPVERKDLVEIP